MVPNGWFTLKLDEIVKKTQLGSTERHKDDSCQSPIPLLKMGNLNWGGFNLTSLELLPLSKVEEALLLNKGDFLFNTRNTPQLVGKSAVWNGELEKATFDNNINKITFHDDRADSFYMGYYLNTGIGKSKIRSLSAGSTSVAAIYWKDLKNIRIELPPIEEQRKITNILSTWDKAISITERLIDNSKQQKKALMQQLLTGKKRFAGFTKDWKQIHLGDIGKCITGLTYKPSDTVDDGILVLRSSNIQDSKLAFEDNVFVNANLKVKSKTQENDILVCVRNGSKNLIGKSTLIKGRAIGQAHGAFMTLFRGKYPLYVSQLFQSDEFFRQVNMNLGATINSINTSDLHKFKFSIPTDENEINAIAACLSNAEKEIEVLQQQLADLKLEKKALMQQLLTGKRRVNVEQKDVA